MKKIFVICVSILLSAISFEIYAETTKNHSLNSESFDSQTSRTYISRTYVARESDGTIYGYIRLSSDGRYSMQVDDISYSGTYYIDADDFNPGDTCTIVFNINGRECRGRIAWATNGDEGIGLDGIWFDVQ